MWWRDLRRRIPSSITESPADRRLYELIELNKKYGNNLEPVNLKVILKVQSPLKGFPLSALRACDDLAAVTLSQLRQQALGKVRVTLQVTV